MNGCVNSLCDMNSIVIPREMLELHVDEQQVEAQLRQLSLRYAGECAAECVAEADIVCCRAGDRYPDGREVLIYTGVQIPGAETAEQAVLGKAAGDRVETVLCGKAVTLTVERILRRIPAQVDDELIASIGIEGVDTVEAYRCYSREKMLADMTMERKKELSSYILAQMGEHSTYSYDESELERYVKAFREEMLTYYGDEAAAMSQEEMHELALSNAKREWIAEAVAKNAGVHIDMAEVEAEADQMAEMMALMGENVPDRQELIDSAVRNVYSTEMFALIDEIVKKQMGGSDGND